MTTTQTTNESGTMTIERTAKRTSGTTIDGSGFVMYGTRPDNGKWFERWFATADKAANYAAKKGWTIK